MARRSNNLRRRLYRHNEAQRKILIESIAAAEEEFELEESGDGPIDRNALTSISTAAIAESTGIGRLLHAAGFNVDTDNAVTYQNATERMDEAVRESFSSPNYMLQSINSSRIMQQAQGRAIRNDYLRAYPAVEEFTREVARTTRLSNTDAANAALDAVAEFSSLGYTRGGTVTGRFSSRNPNPSYNMRDVDYSQIERRIIDRMSERLAADIDSMILTGVTLTDRERVERETEQADLLGVPLRESPAVPEGLHTTIMGLDLASGPDRTALAAARETTRGAAPSFDYDSLFYDDPAELARQRPSAEEMRANYLSNPVIDDRWDLYEFDTPEELEIDREAEQMSIDTSNMNTLQLHYLTQAMQYHIENSDPERPSPRMPGVKADIYCERQVEDMSLRISYTITVQDRALRDAVRGQRLDVDQVGSVAELIGGMTRDAQNDKKLLERLCALIDKDEVVTERLGIANPLLMKTIRERNDKAQETPLSPAERGKVATALQSMDDTAVKAGGRRLRVRKPLK